MQPNRRDVVSRRAFSIADFFSRLLRMAPPCSEDTPHDLKICLTRSPETPNFRPIFAMLKPLRYSASISFSRDMTTSPCLQDGLRNSRVSKRFFRIASPISPCANMRPHTTNLHRTKALAPRRYLFRQKKTMRHALLQRQSYLSGFHEPFSSSPVSISRLFAGRAPRIRGYTSI